MIGIIDYGAGNQHSVKKAIEFLNEDVRIVDSVSGLEEIDGLILPGVGSFGSAVEKLTGSGMYDDIRNWIKEDRPFLGICLGMQMLFEKSDESPDAEGLGVFKGDVKRFEAPKVPQMGWNGVKPVAGAGTDSGIFEGILKNEHFYFLHSYYVRPAEQSEVLATTDYTLEYASAVGRGNICGVQFHPEKSGDAGLMLLGNWVRTC